MLRTMGPETAGWPSVNGTEFNFSSQRKKRFSDWITKQIQPHAYGRDRHPRRNAGGDGQDGEGAPGKPRGRAAHHDPEVRPRGDETKDTIPNKNDSCTTAASGHRRHRRKGQKQTYGRTAIPFSQSTTEQADKNYDLCDPRHDQVVKLTDTHVNCCSPKRENRSPFQVPVEQW